MPKYTLIYYVINQLMYWDDGEIVLGRHRIVSMPWRYRSLKHVIPQHMFTQYNLWL